MTTLNTNVAALITTNAIRVNSRHMSQAMERLSTGKRINSGADDPAGVAVSASLEPLVGTVWASAMLMTPCQCFKPGQVPAKVF
jgi:hypothetical protein